MFFFFSKGKKIIDIGENVKVDFGFNLELLFVCFGLVVYVLIFVSFSFFVGKRGDFEVVCFVGLLCGYKKVMYV